MIKDKYPERFEVRLSTESREKFRKLIGTTQTKIARELIDTVAGMNKETWNSIQNVLKVENVPLSVLLRNTLLYWLIRVDEQIILHGDPDSSDLLLFAKENDSPVDFESIYRPTYRRDLERAACEDIQQNKERWGIPLEGWEKELLIKHENHSSPARIRQRRR